jgi:O-acetylserine/cysteine efflux transporter
MPASQLVLTLCVIMIWGCNFIFIKLGLREMSPFLLCAVRFFFASVPAVFFVRPPAVPFRLVLAYGLITFALQFALLFMAMREGVAPGLASLLLQVQIFFSVIFAVVFLGEKPSLWQVVGALIASMGIILVALHIQTDTVTWLGFTLVLAASAAWGIGNLVSKKLGKVNMMALVVWGSFVACPPLLLLAWLFDPPGSIINSLYHVTSTGILSIVYIVCAATWFCYGVWNWLLSRYPVASIVPFTLLVPIFGMLSSAVVFGEVFEAWKLLAAALIMLGLGVNFLGPRYAARRALRRELQANAASP